MRVLILVLLSVSQITFAKAEDVSTFKIREEKVKFYNYPDMHLTVSTPCSAAAKGKLCSNLQFLKSVSVKKLGEAAVNEQNPSSVICSKTLNGKIYIGLDKDNNENSFCQLPNNSYIDVGTISYYANKNDGLVQKPRDKAKYKK